MPLMFGFSLYNPYDSSPTYTKIAMLVMALFGPIVSGFHRDTNEKRQDSKTKNARKGRLLCDNSISVDDKLVKSQSAGNVQVSRNEHHVKARKTTLQFYCSNTGCPSLYDIGPFLETLSLLLIAVITDNTVLRKRNTSTS